MKTHTQTLTEKGGRVEREQVALVAARMIMEAETGSHVILTIRPATGKPSEQLAFAYSTPAARSHAEEIIAAGQRHASAGEGKAPEGPPLDVLLFWMGDTQERQRLVIAAAHDAIPDEFAPRKETTLGDRTGALAARIGMVVGKATQALRFQLNAIELVKRAEAAEQALHADKARMDFLERCYIHVRWGLRYGSRELFSSAPRETVDDKPSDIRAQLDAAIAAHTWATAD